jgi:hypothetical protein
MPPQQNFTLLLKLSENFTLRLNQLETGTNLKLNYLNLNKLLNYKSSKTRF